MKCRHKRSLADRDVFVNGVSWTMGNWMLVLTIRSGLEFNDWYFWRQDMIRWMFIVGFLVVRLSAGFADERRPEWQDALQYLRFGNEYLLSEQPESALEQLQMASSSVDWSDRSSSPIRFLILFSQVICYDCLGLDEERGQAIQWLHYVGDECANAEEDFSEENDGQAEGRAERAIEFLQRLTLRARSSDVQYLLLSLIEDMAHKRLMRFEFCSAVSTSRRFDYGNDSFSGGLV
jgi:hypothetical protein